MSHSTVTIEGCAESAREAAECFAAGADRIELCRVLSVGGLTPEPEQSRRAATEVPGPVHVLVRPRPGGFELAPGELAGLLDEIRHAIEAGAAGIVVGALDRGGRVDLGAMREVMGVCSYVPVTFHRAFDELEDPLLGLEDLETLGVARVLTSGCAPDAWAGRSVLRELVETSRGVTILGGGGVRGDHVRALVEETGLDEVHARAAAIPELVAALRSSDYGRDAGRCSSPTR